MKICTDCGCECEVVERPDTVHHGEYRCFTCGKHNGWAPKPSDVETQRKRKQTERLRALLPEDRRDWCWSCLRHKSTLIALTPPVHTEIHHVIPVEDGGTDDPVNLQVLCKECHAEVHRRRFAFKRYERAS